MKLSDYIFSILKESGIRHVFTLPGGGAMHLVDSLGLSGIPYTVFAHEQGAAIAAEAYGQHTNRPALLLVTSGPGATNAITAVTAGWIDSTPMLVISGQAKRPDLVGDRGVRQIGSQEVNIIGMVQGITKYAVEVTEPETIRYHLERALHEAVTGRPGPVWMSVPLDVQGAQIDPDALRGYEPEKKTEVPQEVQDAVSRTIALIKESRKPLFLAGNGIKLSGAEQYAERFLKQTAMPVETTWKTIDMFDEEDPNYVGHPGIMGDRAANRILQEADLLLCVGSRLDSSITAFDEPHFAKCAKKIIVDIDQNEIRRMDMDKEVALACDAGAFLKALCEESELQASQDMFSGWLKQCKELRGRWPVVTDAHRETGAYVSAYYFIETMCRLLSEKDVIVPESSGGAGEITYQAFRVKKGQKIKNAAGLGSMGFGLPYAIGACIANDCRRTILINGDGAFQLNIQELETLHRLRLPVKMFVWSNGGYASIRSMQRNNFEGRYVASSAESGHTVPDFMAVAGAYGFQTYRMCSNEEMQRMLPEILADDSPCFCEVCVSPDEVCWPRVKAMPQPDGSMKSGALEDMWPPATADQAEGCR